MSARNRIRARVRAACAYAAEHPGRFEPVPAAADWAAFAAAAAKAGCETAGPVPPSQLAAEVAHLQERRQGVGLHGTHGQGVHPHSGRELPGQQTRHVVEGGLGGAVGHEARIDQAGHGRGDVDDGAPVSFQHVGDRETRQQKGRGDVEAKCLFNHPVDDLMNNLLYYVARSSTAGERISEIRSAFNLSELLTGDEQVEQAREALSAPSVQLMKTVAAAIREDLGRVKDVLDIFVRTGMNKSAELVPQLELLKKISDTLGVLGLVELRTDIEGEIDRLKGVVERGGVANDQIILDIASTLLRVEDRLDHQLVKLTVPQEGAPTALDADLPEGEAADYQKVAESVMRECIINLAQCLQGYPLLFA